MKLDEELCLCFHVRKRKIVNFLRLEKPHHLSQLSECGGAGTGCGWCRQYLKKLFEGAKENNLEEVVLPSADEYAKSRTGYIRDKK